MDFVVEWIESLKSAWLKKDVDSIVKLFDENCENYDSPFSKCTKVYDDWLEIKTQEINSIDYKILVSIENECVVEFIIDYDIERCSAINHIKFNSIKKCIYLKQWYMCEYK